MLPKLEDFDAILSEVDDVVNSAAILQEKLLKDHGESRKRRCELGKRVTAALAASAEAIKSERDKLEEQLAEQLQRIHSLESSHIAASMELCSYREGSRVLSKGLRPLRVHMDVDNMASDEIRSMRETHRRLHSHSQGLETDLEGAYVFLDTIELEISDRRHATAVTDSLERARRDLPHTLQQDFQRRLQQHED